MRCSSSSRASCAPRCARSIASGGMAARSSCSCSPAPCSTPRSPSPKGCANKSKAIHSRSTASRFAGRRASACRPGRIRGSPTVTRWCARPTTRCMSPKKRDAIASYASTAPNTTSILRRTMDHTNPPEPTYTPPTSQDPLPSQTPGSVGSIDGDLAGGDAAHLRSRIAELQRERDHLLAVVDILQDISTSLHFVDILQTISRKMGESFELDRCAIFLSGDANEVRLVASYEDPTIRNLVVDLNRYPELKRTFETGETVFIPDVATEPSLRTIRSTLDALNVRAIVVVPIQWQGTVIGAIFLRTRRDAEAFSNADMHFCQVIASLTARALRNAHRFEALLHDQKEASRDQRRADLQRVALIAFVRRLLDRHTSTADHVWAETLLPKASDEELERLVTVAMQVIDEEAKG